MQEQLYVDGLTNLIIPKIHDPHLINHISPYLCSAILLPIQNITGADRSGRVKRAGGNRNTGTASMQILPPNGNRTG